MTEKEFDLKVDSLLDKYINYNTHVAKHYRDYLDIYHSIRYIKRLCNYYTKYYSLEAVFIPVDSERVLEDSTLIPMFSIGVTIVILYGKCFDSNPDRRQIKLKDDFLNGSSPELIKIHKELIKIRNRYLAHAGVSQYEQYEVCLGIHNDRHLRVKENSDNYTSFLGEIIESETLMPLLDEVELRVEKRIKALLIKVEEELDLLEKDKFKTMSILENQKELNDKDLKYFKNL